RTASWAKYNSRAGVRENAASRAAAADGATARPVRRDRRPVQVRGKDSEAMKVCVVVLALSVMLAAAPTYAQAPAAPAPQTPAPAQPAAAQPAAPTPRFQDGLKYAYVQLEQVAAFSNQGKAFNAKVQALQEQKVKELQDKNKALQA